MADVRAKFPQFVEQHDRLRRYRETYGPAVFDLLPLTRIHHSSTINYPLGTTSNPIYVLSGIAAVVLLIACVNFMTLSLGLASTRFKEVGVRKVMGASRIHLAKRFWGDALLLSMLSLVLSIALVELILPIFSGLVDRNLSLHYDSTWGVLFGLAVCVGLIGGSYPALVMSGFHPVVVLKGAQRIGGENIFSRTLVAFQFAASMILIVMTLMMSEQFEFMRTKDLGFNSDHVVMIDTQGKTQLGRTDRERLLALYRQADEQYNDIVNVSMSSISLGDVPVWGMSNRLPDGGEIGYRTFVVDYDFFETMEMNLIEGRRFLRDSEADQEESIVINESMRKALGWTSEEGKVFPFGKRTVVGVVSDFHMRSLHHEMELAAFTLKRGNGYLRYIVVRIRPEDIAGTLAILEETWGQVVQDRPFVFSFLDDDIEHRYREDQRWARIVGYAGIFAIFIACLGAFGLTSLAVARRTKEVGIRKVMGASTGHIVKLFSLAFVKLILGACVIAFPVAYYILDRWLQEFAYRVDIGMGTFLLGGLLTLFVVLLTVGVQAIKAALANPVDALRYE